MSHKTDIARDLSIDENDLNREFIQQPGLVSHYIDLLAQARAAAKRKKLFIDTFVAALDGQIRDVARARGQKITETQIENMIRRDANWNKHMMELIDLETAVEQLEGVVKGILQKKDMLGHIAYERSREMAMPSFYKEDREIPVIRAG